MMAVGAASRSLERETAMAIAGLMTLQARKFLVPCVGKAVGLGNRPQWGGGDRKANIVPPHGFPGASADEENHRRYAKRDHHCGGPGRQQLPDSLPNHTIQRSRVQLPRRRT